MLRPNRPAGDAAGQGGRRVGAERQPRPAHRRRHRHHGGDRVSGEPRRREGGGGAAPSLSRPRSQRGGRTVVRAAYNAPTVPFAHLGFARPHGPRRPSAPPRAAQRRGPEDGGAAARHLRARVRRGQGLRRQVVHQRVCGARGARLQRGEGGWDGGGGNWQAGAQQRGQGVEGDRQRQMRGGGHRGRAALLGCASSGLQFQAGCQLPAQ